uniref:Methylcrotonoyl-CoA carboxylase subunit alpha, mitochondrial n=1 Tax=Clastoptera arizonana TaxID=38151 RepID=A0A1B6DQH7_9HEMI
MFKTYIYPRFINLKQCYKCLFLTHIGLRYGTTSNKVVPIRIRKLLIANRGEIACRIIRTAKRLGVQTVAVYSDVDKDSMHVHLADEAYNIGRAASQESYLRGDKILSIAHQARVNAIHPGYGFLSENAEFAEQCQKEGIIFIGPPASAIRDMGIKSTSKAIMSNAGVPIIEGYHGDDQSDARLIKEADHIGYPIMIKAVRGGGGKGMRIALTPEEFKSQLSSARREALKSFGNDEMLLERYIKSPRHVEVQVFADKFKNCVYLFERDCSVQRRHQKVIEEAPAPGISTELRRKLGEAGVRAAQAVGYVGAGTVEFILDPTSLNFHFMEMNTRLQVEHPVTEMITGTDLVEWQIKVASGLPLPMTQDHLDHPQGHSFEARIYAEDPNSDFLPGAGPLVHLDAPEPSEEVRIETGVREGDEVSVHYDPMIAKLVVWGEDRTTALEILRKKLAEFHIAGLHTNINFLIKLCSNLQFQLGNVHTGFISEQKQSLLSESRLTSYTLAQAALAVVLYDAYSLIASTLKTSDPFSPFGIETWFRVGTIYIRTLRLTHQNKEYKIRVKFEKNDKYSLCVEDSKEWLLATGDITNSASGFFVRSEIDYVVSTVKIFIQNENVHLFTKDGSYSFELPERKARSMNDEVLAVGEQAVSPMPGVIDKVFVEPKTEVKIGDPLLVIIAMKMEHVIKSPKNGIVKSILFQSGENVPKNVPLVQWEEESVVAI